MNFTFKENTELIEIRVNAGGLTTGVAGNFPAICLPC